MQRHCLVSLALGFLVLAASASAQQIPPALANSTPEQRAQMQTQVMKEKLALTDAQLPKVSAINLQIAQKMEPVIKGNDRALVKVREMRAAEHEREAALQGVLTPEQMQQFQAAREEIKQKVEQRLIEKSASGGSP